MPVDPLSTPGKYKIESKYGVHSLVISRYHPNTLCRSKCMMEIRRITDDCLTPSQLTKPRIPCPPPWCWFPSPQTGLSSVVSRGSQLTIYLVTHKHRNFFFKSMRMTGSQSVAPNFTLENSSAVGVKVLTFVSFEPQIPPTTPLSLSLSLSLTPSFLFPLSLHKVSNTTSPSLLPYQARGELFMSHLQME